MINISNTTNECYIFYQDASGRTGKPGLTVTIDIWSPNKTPLVEAGACIEIGQGLYYYPRLMVTPGLYPFIAHTAATDVLQQDIAGVWQIGGWPDTILTDIADLQQAVYDLTHTTAGELVPIVIPPPSGAHVCRVWERCYDIASQSPLETITATAQIRQAYELDDKMHSIQVVEGTLSDVDENGDQYVYWDIVQGAKVIITIEEIGILKKGTVPAGTSVRVRDLQ